MSDEKTLPCPGCTDHSNRVRHGFVLTGAEHVSPCSLAPYQILYWDKLNEDEETSHQHVFVGEPEVHEIAAVLEHYADLDGDGHTDGIYEDGHPFIVKFPDGSWVEWEVYVEMVPVFRARFGPEKREAP